MGKVGNIFRDTRLGKGLTLDQVADETNISKRFLQGIENDNFDGFPGEVYIIGFIRNYAEFLGLNPAETVARFKAAEPEPEPPSQDKSPEKPSSETPEAIEPIAKSPDTQTSAETKPARKEPEVPLLFTEESEEAEAKASTLSSEHAKSGKMPRTSKKQAVATHPSEPEKAPPVAGPASVTESEAPLAKAQPSLTDSQKEKIALSHQPSFPARKNQKVHAAPIQLGHFLLYALAILIIIVGVVSMLPRLKLPSRASRTPADYRAEGLPFEQRLYPQDRVYLPLGNDFISVTLKSVKDKVVLDTPSVDLRLPAATAVTRLELPEGRWLLAVFADTFLGPAVLYWGFLAVVAAMGLGLSFAPESLLTRWQWLLYALGLSQATPWGAVLAAAWLVALGWRRRHWPQGAFAFDAAQVGLVLLCLAGFGALYDVLGQGLLGLPRMQVAGPGQTAGPGKEPPRRPGRVRGPNP